MSNSNPSTTPLGALVTIVVYAVVAAGLAFGGGATEPVGAMIPMSLIGGGLMAAVLIVTRSPLGSAAPVTDRFERDATSGDVMNMARVRVAGVGGVGLVFVAGLVALEYHLTTVALIAGVVGGVIAALVMILHRRR